MPLVCYVTEDNGKNRVTLFHYRPNELPEEIRRDCIMVDEIPRPDFSLGEVAIPYIDLETKAIYYEYISYQEDLEV